ncbi:LOW QUALITY PROTEIN: odorant receptor 22a-like [Drosophila eugracilis]|uniref:LOW QUALITY PROTEIN: odorant receptor 22a-like n=1 Tax=Drosophila eugracilis TaxID=29029 RepID=UPI001BD9CF77|nr:LOW QUALITY PROTEIN: odorant receptor 22a-like [Drosophila eugracilis]
MLSKLFPWIKEKPLSEPCQSRDAFTYLDRVMWTFGWTEPENKRWTWLYNLWALFTSLLIFIFLPISMGYEYIKRFKSFSAGEFLSSLEIGVNIYGNSFKCGFTLIAFRKREKAKNILDKLDERCLMDEEKSTVHRYVAMGNFCYMVYHICYWFFVFVNVLVILVKGRHAWRMFVPLINSEQHFVVSNFAEFTMMLLAVTMDQCTDTVPLVSMLMARCHMSLLKERLKNLRSDPGKSNDEDLQELTQCIRDHRMILDYVNLLRDVLSGTIFAQFLLIGVVLGLSLINLMFFSTLWTGFGTCVFMFDVCMETFPFCYLCNMIIDDCQELANCLFHSNWTSADRRYKSTMVYFLHNLQQPIILMAGGVFPVCMQTNLSMVKLAFSVVTVIKQFNIAEKFQ